MDFRQWLQQATARLVASDSPKRDAEILLGYATGRSRTFIVAFDETQLSTDELAKLEILLTRRQQGEPIAYIVGQREFWSLPLQVSPATLIPRPDTECLVEQALMRLPADGTGNILDLGTGTGAIALAIASERPGYQVLGVDINPDAVELALLNQHQLQIKNTKFIQSHWFSSLSSTQFDMIVSNPPYIDKEDEHLQQGDVRFEPLTALVADFQGLSDLAWIIDHASDYLVNKGWLLLEHGWQQGEQVRQLFNLHGYHHIATCQDYGLRDRVSVGQWKSDEKHS
ncbi:peptide chain release factor N(5)-glutamine methyltransferase [Moellerella wisconsensis]|uniref:Release factor glutamine methyltransferase n=1 Tax=Moellerella wisconsensis TaxID=158849 RepID=A0A9Q8V5W6_9GAMM|nr:peptide chain release factor N(5)-glutamine methyltransferase [Moellerella wisconsensis]KLN96944.1 SAM-dependent methyltransferase [Moellerella wisconsensis]UNH28653.1 peptide chain release factor N(5)-glutamine methyltransferase [Moellerella wisconsensis]UNH32106.1 peptide chain release factor N(5)-glutamine methyltransferase [Moellerella wisconsensis]WJW83134.1 peptide chain release factor N(5)-glutamine methyltransferase [Moellerella wisconsensis]